MRKLILFFALLPASAGWLAALPARAQSGTTLVAYLTWSNGAAVQATLTLKDSAGTVLATTKTCCTTGWASVTVPLSRTQFYTAVIHADATATTPALDYQAPITLIPLPSNVTVSRAELHAAFSTSLPIKVTAWKLITSGTA
jgi:hypothetical protein